MQKVKDCGCKFKNNYSNEVVLCKECSKLPCHNKSNTCKHKDFSRKTIMDFSFYICNDCGHQWKV